MHLNFEENLKLYSITNKILMRILSIKTIIMAYENLYIIQKYKKCFTIFPKSSGSCTNS